VADKAWLSAEEEAELRAQARAKQTEIETWRDALLSILTARFGRVPRATIERIENCCDVAELEQLVSRSAKISTIEHL
jgi:hypothetical protein